MEINTQWPSPFDPPLAAGQIILFEASPGRARREHLVASLNAAQRTGARCWLLDCDIEEGGIWAGVAELFQEHLPAMQRLCPDLITLHDYELAVVLPQLQRTLEVRNPNLTELSPTAERTRNYAADRAYRIVQGLVELLAAFRPWTEPVPWVIACDNFDRAGALAVRFFAELSRRCIDTLQLTLLLTAAPDAAESVVQRLAASVVRRERLEIPHELPPPAPDKEAMGRIARELSLAIKDDLDFEAALPRLIQCASRGDDPQRALPLYYHACTIYVSRGFYEDALGYGAKALELLERHQPDDVYRRLDLYKSLSNCYAALGQGERAREVAMVALAATDDPNLTYPWCYLVAMLYARFLPKRDLATAEMYLERGLQEIERAHLLLHERLFQIAFNRNGLALIRHFQKRHAEAIELCQRSFEMLNEHLGPTEHKLHRSVLLYNIAQVYVSTGHLEEALPSFAAAMAMDPNYSEYYNERGNVYLRLGRLEEARTDYMKAIELSPPYMEVWSNLGQCYSLMDRPDDAASAYTRAIDLAPDHVPSRIARAQALETLGAVSAALSDYDAVLALDSRQPLILAARAVLRYEGGDMQAALDDLNQAIDLDPTIPDLYQNRAAALAELGRPPEACADLQHYLNLNQDAPDRNEVEARLAVLRSMSVSAA